MSSNKGFRALGQAGLPPHATDLEALARARWGEPSARYGQELRFGRRGSKSLDLARGLWFDHETGQGGGPSALALAAGSRECPAYKGARASSPHSARGRVAAARSLWAAGRPVRPDDLAGRYLAARALPPPWPNSLRFHPAVWCAEVGRPLPALLAAAWTNCAATIDQAIPGGVACPSDRVVAVQRTWLAEPGRKAALDAPKKALGPLRGAVVWIARPAVVMVVAEGVETAVSAGRALGLSAAASLGAAGMRAFSPPAGTVRVIIAPDRDASGVGARAARALAERLARAGIVVALAWPPGGAKDWNDWAMAQLGLEETRNGR